MCQPCLVPGAMTQRFVIIELHFCSFWCTVQLCFTPERVKSCWGGSQSCDKSLFLLPVAFLLRLYMLCTVTVARSHPRNVWECCSRSRSHCPDSLPSTWECFTLLCRDISVWKSCQLTGTCFQLASLQLCEGREEKESKLCVHNSPFSFCNLSKNRTAASCILDRSSGAFIECFSLSIKWMERKTEALSLGCADLGLVYGSLHFPRETLSNTKCNKWL